MILKPLVSSGMILRFAADFRNADVDVDLPDAKNIGPILRWTLDNGWNMMELSRYINSRKIYVV